MARADYEQISARYDDERGGQDIPREELVAQLLQMRSAGIRFLDVGCGTGNHLAAQHRFFDRLPVTFIGIDPSHGMLSAARAKLGSGGLIRGRAEALPFNDAVFGVVFSTLAFHHFEDKERALVEMTRVLKPSGYLKMTNVDPWSVRAWWLYRFFPSAQLIDQQRFWPADRLVTALEQRGLRVDARIEFTPRRWSPKELLKRAEMRVTSQLAIMDDEQYKEGLAQLRALIDSDPDTVLQDEVGWLHLVAHGPRGQVPGRWPAS